MTTNETPNSYHQVATPLTDAAVTGNSVPTQEEYENLAFHARTLERANAALRAEVAERIQAHALLSGQLDRAEAEVERMRAGIDSVVKYCDERIVPDYKAVIDSLKAANAALRAALDDLLSTCEAQGIRADLLAQSRAALGKEKSL